MFQCQPARILHRAASVASRPQAQAHGARFFSTTCVRFANKDSQDKDSLKPRSTEYTKSGSDDAAASSDAAFNPNKTSPEAAEASADQEASVKDKSLNVSPVNKRVSEANDAQVGGHGGAPEKKASSRRSAPKNG